MQANEEWGGCPATVRPSLLDRNADELIEESKKRKAGQLEEQYTYSYKKVKVEGSEADCERVFSECCCLMPYNRGSLTPIMLEAIMMLRYSPDLWDEHTILMAYATVIKEAREDRLAAKEKKAAEEEENAAQGGDNLTLP